MKVKLRHEDEVQGIDFCTVKNVTELKELIQFVKESGVYVVGKDILPLWTHQIVLDGEAYVELTVGNASGEKSD